MEKKHILIIVLVAAAAFWLGNSFQQPSASPTDVPKIKKSSQITQAERTSMKLARQEKRNNKLKNTTEKDAKTRVKNDETDAEKQAKKQLKREAQIDQRLTEKTWWNKGGSKFKSIVISDETKALMDNSMQQLLTTRKQLGVELFTAKQANQAALAQGDTPTITANLKQIEDIHMRWLTARNQAITDIIAELSTEQLKTLSELGGDVAALNWLDFSLNKGLENLKSKKHSARRNKNLKN